MLYEDGKLLNLIKVQSYNSDNDNHNELQNSI